MDSRVWTIARDEWRYWRRSKLAMTLLLIAVLLASTSVIVTYSSVNEEANQREHLQLQAEQTFVGQPDRHPHRMVHYGHYLFRSPPPLGRLDPGIDPFTGTSIFLEGHRQNGSTFAQRQQSSGLTWLGTLSPAFVMQVLMPLLLILIGYGVMTREREAGTFEFLKVQGVAPIILIMGKGLALAGAGLLVLMPLLLGALWSLLNGASLLPVAAFILSYVIYLTIWCGFVLLASVLSTSNTTSFSSLIGVWILCCLIIPRVASNTATVVVASPGKLETDFAVLQKLRELGDGHNANDPAFNALKDNLLAKYQVDSVEALPINFKGVVAQHSEAQLTQVLNQFAEQQMREALSQAQVARQFGWLSPVIAIQTASMKLAGTDLENYQRFLREAETVRYDFVQAMNRLHAEAVSYADDVNKYQDHDTHQRAKADASHWDIIQDFHFTPLTPKQLVMNSLNALLQLMCICAAVLSLIFFAGRRL